MLVKCAFTGADPNWGRIVMAIGKSAATVDSSVLTVDIDDVCLVREGGLVSPEAARRARKAMRKDSFRLVIGVGSGNGCATIVTSDLTEPYVRFNSAYTS
jgi:glutamate N-acetyltransferase/amino-acid N-acetyltransferase